jgi:hypothetical protein
VTYITHITLTTGHSRRSPRAEVPADVVSVLHPWLASSVNTGAIHPIPVEHFADFGAICFVDGGCLVVTVYGAPVQVGEREPLVTFGVAQRSRHAKKLWDLMLSTSQPGQVKPGLSMPEPPFCVARLYLGMLGRYPGAAEWIGDFERCVAWAWITKQPQFEAIK